MKGYYKRNIDFDDNGGLYHPEIHIKVVWREEPKYVSVITYTPDLYEKAPEWAYELYNDYNDITFRTLFRWAQFLYYGIKEMLIKCYDTIYKEIIEN